MSKKNPSFEASSSTGSQIQTSSQHQFENQKTATVFQLPKTTQQASLGKINLKTPPNNSNKKIWQRGSKKPGLSTPGESSKKRVNARKLTQRFEDFQDKVRQKISNLARELEDVQTKQCIFKRGLNTQRPPRTLKQFLRQKDQFQTSRQQKIERLKKEQNQICSISPSLYARMPSNPSQDQVQGNLYYQKSGQNNNILGTLLNGGTKEFKRAQTIDIIEGRKKAKSKTKHGKTVKKQRRSSVFSKTGKLVIDKFIKQFESVFFKLDIDKKNKLNYLKFRNLLEKMNFIKNCPANNQNLHQKELIIKAWQLLVKDSESYVEKEQLKIFLLSILNLAEDYTTQTGDNAQKTTNIIFPLGKSKKFHNIFNLFYENRSLTTCKQKSTSPATSKPRRQLTQMTLKLAQNIETKRKILFGDQKKQDILISQKKALHQKTELKKEALVKKQIDQCTFRPKINQKIRKKSINSEKETSSVVKETPRYQVLYSLSRVRNDRLKENQTNRLLSELEKSMYECSFRPRINRSSSIKSLGNSISKISKTRKKESKTPKPMKCGIDFTHKSKSAFDTFKQVNPL